MQVDAVATAAAAASSASDAMESKTNQSAKGQHGGWMKKAANMAAWYRCQDWHTFEGSVAQWEADNPQSFGFMLNKAIKAHRWP